MTPSERSELIQTALQTVDDEYIRLPRLDVTIDQYRGNVKMALARALDAPSPPPAPQPEAVDGWIRTSEMTPQQAGFADTEAILVCDSDDTMDCVDATVARHAKNYDYWQRPPKPPVSVPAPAEQKAERPADDEETIIEAIHRAEQCSAEGELCDSLMVLCGAVERLARRNPSAGSAGEE